MYTGNSDESYYIAEAKKLEESQHNVDSILHTDKCISSTYTLINIPRYQNSSTELSQLFEQLSTTFLQSTFLLTKNVWYIRIPDKACGTYLVLVSATGMMNARLTGY